MPGGQDAGVDGGLARRYSIFDDEDEDDLLAEAQPPAVSRVAGSLDAGMRDAGAEVDAARRVVRLRDASAAPAPVVVVAPAARDAGTYEARDADTPKDESAFTLDRPVSSSARSAPFHYVRDPKDNRLLAISGDTDEAARANADRYTRLRQAGEPIPSSLAYRDVAPTRDVGARDAGTPAPARVSAPARYWALLEDHRGKQTRLEARSAGEVRRQFRELEELTQDEGGPGAYVLVSDGDEASLSGLTSPAYAASMRKRVADAGAAPSDDDVMTFSADEVEPVVAPSPRRVTAPDASGDIVFSADEVAPVIAPRDAGMPAVRRVARARAIVDGGRRVATVIDAGTATPERVVDAEAPVRELAPTDAGVSVSRSALTDAGAEPVARTVQARDIVAAGPPPPPRDAGAARSLSRSVNDPRDPTAPPMQLRASSRDELDRLHEEYTRTRAPDAGVAPSYDGLYTPAGKPVQMSAIARAPNGDFVKLVADDTSSLDRYAQFVDRHPGAELTTTGDPYLVNKMREARAAGSDAGTSTMDAGTSTTDAVRRAVEVVRGASADAARRLPDVGDAGTRDAGAKDRYGAIEPGNVDLTRRPHVKNADGSTSTVLSMGTELDGKEYLLPLVHDDGYIMTPDQAVAEFRKTGKHLGVYASPEDSTRAGQLIHEDQEKNPPTDTLAAKDDDDALARVAEAARVVSGENINRLPDKAPDPSGPRADLAATPEAPSQESGVPDDLPLDTTLPPREQEKQILEGEKRVAEARVERAEGTAEGLEKVAEQHGKIAAQSADSEQRTREAIEGARKRAGTIEQRMLGLMDHIEKSENEKPKRDTLHMIMTILTSVLLAKVPGGAAAAKLIMQALPTATNKWADTLSADREQYDRLAKMYGLTSHGAASELEQEAMLSAAGMGTLKAGLNGILNSNASDDAKKLARETLELANNQIRGHARDIGSRELRDLYARLPVERLQAMEDAGELGTEGQAILHERIKQGQAERKADIDAEKGEADIDEAPVRRKKLEGEVAAEQAEAPLRREKMEAENAEAPLRKKALEADVRLKNANALEAETRAKFGPKPTERETQLDVLTRSGAQSFERLAKMAKAGQALPMSAMALGTTLSKLDPQNAQTRRDVGLLTSLVLRNESGAVIGPEEWDKRFDELGLNAANEGIRRNALAGLLQSFEGMDRLRFLSGIDWDKDPPNAITSIILAEAAAKKKAQEGAGERNATEGQTGRGAGRVTGKAQATPAPAAEPRNPQLEAKLGFDAKEFAARMRLTEAARSSTPAVTKVYNEQNEERKAGGDLLFEALQRNYTLTPKPPALLDYYRGIREARQRGKAPAGGAR